MNIDIDQLEHKTGICEIPTCKKAITVYKVKKEKIDTWVCRACFEQSIDDKIKNDVYNVLKRINSCFEESSGKIYDSLDSFKTEKNFSDLEKSINSNVGNIGREIVKIEAEYGFIKK